MFVFCLFSFACIKIEGIFRLDLEVVDLTSRRSEPGKNYVVLFCWIKRCWIFLPPKDLNKTKQSEETWETQLFHLDEDFDELRAHFYCYLG